ncbi:MAG: restriction endonuclease subunit S [candidate division Zixibacteria bacterium]|nr:restriction endonuclease subunit S [candidate division Zixibacteria bacterium]
MAIDWRQTTWGEEISLEYGKSLRDYKDVKGQFRVYGTNGPVGWTTDPLAPGPGVILGRKGAYRGVEYSKEPFFVIDTAYYVKPKTDLNMRWLYYAIKHYKLGEIDDGSPIPSTTRSAVYVRALQVPSSEIQRAIAHILGSLDDKIELNRQMNRTLEKMAQAIFKSWFIEFDPVHAKAEGRETGLPKKIADLFPDSFEDSELGEIPKGWTTGKLADLTDNPKRSQKPGDVSPRTPYIGLKHLPRKSIALDSWGFADEVDSQKSYFHKGEILFGKLRPYFHKTGIAPTDGVCSTDILVLCPKEAQWKSYVLFLVSTKAFVDFTDSHSAGTKMPRTNWKDMSKYPITLPPQDLMEVFENTCSKYTERIVENIIESRTLSQTRDTLLPKLISGELTIPDAKKLLEGVG